ncbi:hypothetical protein B0T11DRAFT_297867 [Plectosphaerella cucumerina]|uniref:Core Histone H2A/H2B/H3 domain-containing protein n=1 Tax=Plectosphaerella cucumerina TaxID=40658 RepID=A0A8K0X4H9_9PEZI|nr:hypothetical protein B0T11DRAFT_297867 [Plectosphaerella cucumerina]
MAFKPAVMGNGKKIRAGRKRHVRIDGTAIENLIKARTHRTRADKDVKAFRRLVKEVCQDTGMGLHIKKLALDVMHAASEAYIIELFRVAKLCASIDSRSTVMPDDLDLAKISLRMFLWPGREVKLEDSH